MNPENLQLSYELFPYKKIPNMPPKGRPPKKKRNISGLKNQPALSVAPLPPIAESTDQSLDDYQDQHDEAAEVDPPPHP